MCYVTLGVLCYTWCVVLQIPWCYVGVCYTRCVVLHLVCSVTIGVLCYTWCVALHLVCCITLGVLCYRSRGVTSACASPVSAGTPKITGATRLTTCTGRWQHLCPTLYVVAAFIILLSYVVLFLFQNSGTLFCKCGMCRHRNSEN